MSMPFIVVEGLTGSGKTSVADSLADRMKLERPQIMPPEFRSALELVENEPTLLDSRYSLFLAGVFAAAARIVGLLGSGRGAVVDSWWYRTVATHTALGSSLRPSLPHWLPRPSLEVFLDLPESDRQARIAGRGRQSGYWKSMCEPQSRTIRELYRSLAPNLVWIDARPQLEDVVSEVEHLAT